MVVYKIWNKVDEVYERLGHSYKSIWLRPGDAKNAIHCHIRPESHDKLEVHEFELIFKRKV